MINPLKMAEMLSQANKMQEDMQRKLAQTVVEGSSGGGAVTATMNGKKELIKLKIDPSAVASLSGPNADVELLEVTHRWCGQRCRTQSRRGDSIQREGSAGRAESEYSGPRLNIFPARVKLHCIDFESFLGVTIMSAINRRNFLRLGIAASAAALAPRWAFPQATRRHLQRHRVAQMRACRRFHSGQDHQAYTTTSGCCRALVETWLCRPGKDGNILIDSSFATAVPHIREAIASVSSDAPHALINTHWHVDHVDGNEGMHAAGFRVIAHTKTKDRMSQPAEMKLFHMSLPAYPAGALPTVTFDSIACATTTTATRSNWSTTIPRIPTRTSISTFTMRMCCTAATSSSTRLTRSSMKVPADRSAAPLLRHRSLWRWPETIQKSSPGMDRWATNPI